MTQTTLGRPAVDDRAPMPAPRKSRPVLIFAVLGAAQLCLLVYCVVGWAGSGQMEPIHHGPDTMPGWAHVVMWTMQLGGVAATAWMVWHFLIRPIRRDGRISTDGMLLVAWFAIAIPNDIIMNYTRYTFGYNSYYLNAGSWMSQVPGVITPDAHRIPEPLIMVIPAYGWAVFLASVLGCWWMRKLRARWPAMRTAALLFLTLVPFMLLDFVFEMLLILGKVEYYGSTIRELTLFAGTNHQFPLYEALFWGAFWTAAAALRFYVDDRGRTVAERGVDELDIPPRQRTIVRQLALIGAAWTLITVFYNLPWNFAGAQANDFPDDPPSYFLNGICGPGTDVPCPSDGSPIYKAR